jgi:transcriptional regulator of acetoin/glycerol metabolism
MFQLKMIHQQLKNAGIRLGDSCTIVPFQGKKKAFTLTRSRFDLVSQQLRPQDLAMSYVELPRMGVDPFHYRFELDERAGVKDRFVLKTLQGHPFVLNGLAVKEAYIERQDKIFIEDHRINFAPDGLEQLIKRRLDHPVLLQNKLMESELKILIIGETGTGKTHLARQIHERSCRRGEFVAINLASYNPQLIESELFGHKKGSFTGAIADRSGAFAHAKRGTLFLDEIDSLPLDLQTKLLTFIDNGRFRQVGETREEEIQARLIFASGRNLEKLVEAGVFRKDFYYRLRSGHCLELRSLRNDLGRIQEVCDQYGIENGVTLSPRLLEFYQTLAWPGNLRQLYGHLEKKRILSRSSRLDFDELDEELMTRSANLLSINEEDTPKSLEQFKQDYVVETFRQCQGNFRQTARRLQVSEKTVRSILSKEANLLTHK